MEKAEAKFDVDYLEEAMNFLESVAPKAREKIFYNINKSRYVIDKDFFKKLGEGDIWEFRTLYNGIQYRLLAFWDTEANTVVVATHGFLKKTQKTPLKEIKRAQSIREQYFKEKTKRQK